MNVETVEKLSVEQAIIYQIMICQRCLTENVNSFNAVRTLLAMIPDDFYDDEFEKDLMRFCMLEEYDVEKALEVSPHGVFHACINLLQRIGLYLHKVEEEVFE